MARRQIIELIDDLDGSPLGSDGATVSFAIDGAVYEIDLSVANAATLHEVLAPFVNAGRKLGRTVATVPATSRRRKNPDDLSAIREWARANGHTVSDRGRIAGPIVEAYRLANA